MNYLKKFITILARRPRGRGAGQARRNWRPPHPYNNHHRLNDELYNNSGLRNMAIFLGEMIKVSSTFNQQPNRGHGRGRRNHRGGREI